MKTFTITLSGLDLEHLDILVNSRVYQGLSEQDIIRNVLCCAMYEEAKLYKELHDLIRKD